MRGWARRLVTVSGVSFESAFGRGRRVAPRARDLTEPWTVVRAAVEDGLGYVRHPRHLVLAVPGQDAMPRHPRAVPLACRA